LSSILSILLRSNLLQAPFTCIEFVFLILSLAESNFFLAKSFLSFGFLVPVELAGDKPFLKSLASVILNYTFLWSKPGVPILRAFISPSRLNIPSDLNGVVPAVILSRFCTIINGSLTAQSLFSCFYDIKIFSISFDCFLCFFIFLMTLLRPEPLEAQENLELLEKAER